MSYLTAWTLLLCFGTPPLRGLPLTRRRLSGVSLGPGIPQCLFGQAFGGDYCNSVLFGLPDSDIKKLQCVQNASACLVPCTKKYKYITSVLIKLHWLQMVGNTGGRDAIWYSIFSQDIGPDLSGTTQLSHTSHPLPL